MSFGNTVPLGTKDAATVADIMWIGPSYFATMAIPRVNGREFEESDQKGVAVVNETLARRLFANRSPLGKRVIIKRNEQ